VGESGHVCASGRVLRGRKDASWKVRKVGEAAQKRQSLLLTSRRKRGWDGHEIPEKREVEFRFPPR